MGTQEAVRTKVVLRVEVEVEGYPGKDVSEGSLALAVKNRVADVLADAVLPVRGDGVAAASVPKVTFARGKDITEK